MSLFNTACDVFNHVTDVENDEIRLIRLTTIINDDYSSFVTCCKKVIHNDEVNEIRMRTEKNPDNPKYRKGVYFLHR